MLYNGKKDFASAATTYTAISKTQKAFKHKGPSQQYPTKFGTETAHEGDYVVQVGVTVKTETVPPKDGKPGFTREHEEPLLEVMKAEDFESLYKPVKD